jgi:rhamnulose-1-phosphate aldolase
VPFELPGSLQLAEKTLLSLVDHRVIVWEKHGCLAIGETISAAFDRIDMFSKAARIYLICRNAGIEPEGLTTDQLKSILNFEF